MKIENRHSLTAVVKGAVAITTATAVLLGQTVPILAASTSDERRVSENAVKKINHIVVIYQENWSFDALYGQFPGANGYGAGFSTLPQYDVHASPPYSQLIYKTPLPLNGGPDPNFPASPDGNLALSSNHNVALPLIPYTLTQYIPADAKTGDLVHRFYHEQLQIDNGVLEPKLGDLDKFVTWK